MAMSIALRSCYAREVWEHNQLSAVSRKHKIWNWQASPNAAMLHLESELESFAPSIFDEVMLKISIPFVFDEGDDEYAIISASMSESVDDISSYLKDS